jgi:peptidoglycan/LPS O-acetylase OafA/YrhL
MNYRKDIQILRGISVLLVLLFHLNIGLFKSGFLGVDIFFVISGFLMAILYEHNNKSTFFARRAMRLLPTYFIVTFLTVLIAIFVVTPNEFTQVATQSFYASTFNSNIGFWLQNSYFSKSEFNPLLHLWSLGVEIQFYLIIPILFFFFRLNRYNFVLILLGTLFLCFTILGFSSKTSFFMMPLRIWEFLIGYSVSLYFTNNGIVTKKNFLNLGNFGLLIILLIPIANIDGESTNYINGHPGLYALIITLSTGLVLAFGISKKIEYSKIGTVLEIFGRYSYSIYLVHFPVIVLYMYEPFLGTQLKPKSIIDTFSLITIISLLSIFMYHIVEQGSRKVKKIKILLYLSPLIILSTTLLGLEIQKILFTHKERNITNAFRDRDGYRCGISYRIMNPNAMSCNITNLATNNIEQKIMLIGNSHADSIKFAFANEAKKMNSDVWFLVSNKALLNSSITAKKIVDEAINKDIDHIVIHYSSVIFKHIERIKKLITLAKDSSIYVSFIMPVPTWDRHIPKALWQKLHDNRPLPKQTLKNYNDRYSEKIKILLELESTGFKIYTIAQLFCNEECKYVNNRGEPLYFDRDHLTLTGSQYLSKAFKKVIADGSKVKQRN